MIADLKPYPAMKDSGVARLGQVPTPWTIMKLRRLLRRYVERNRPDLPLLSVVRDKGVILRDVTDNGENHNYIPDDLTNYKVVHTGQFAMNKMKAWQGSYGVSRYDGIVSPAYFTFDVANIDGAFFHRAIRSSAYVPSFTRASDGVRIGQWDLAESRMREIEFAVPPPDEQAAIVRFLDHADRKIRRAIRAKQKLMKLLEEEKQAIIHRAVTRGLDPNVRLKPSGVEWLGDVPEHWELWQIGRFAKVGNGSTPSRSNVSYWAGGTYPWLNSGTVNSGVVRSSDQFVTANALRECHLPRVPANSVLVAITGQGKTRGKSALLTIEATINQHIAFIALRNPGKVVTSHYVRLFLAAAYNELRRLSDDSGSTKGALTCEDLKHFRVLVPPTPEQQRIAAYIEERTANAAHAQRAADEEIALLREYRTRLIADVVTGKLDVREAAARLPDELQESEAEGDGDSEGDEALESEGDAGAGAEDEAA